MYNICFVTFASTKIPQLSTSNSDDNSNMVVDTTTLIGVNDNNFSSSLIHSINYNCDDKVEVKNYFETDAALVVVVLPFGNNLNQLHKMPLVQLHRLPITTIIIIITIIIR